MESKKAKMKLREKKIIMKVKWGKKENGNKDKKERANNSENKVENKKKTTKEWKKKH